MRRPLAASVLSAMTVAAAWSAQAQQPGPFPEGAGREIVAVACTQCHGAQPITQLRMNDVGWRQATFNMILRGAQIGPNDIEAAVNYLTANFGPGVAFSNQPKADVMLAGGQGKALVEGGCGLCHGLDRVIATRRSPDQWAAMVDRMVEIGAPFTPEQRNEILSYLGTYYAPPAQTAVK
jgi:mono/diheme cytochrome c family protein